MTSETITRKPRPARAATRKKRRLYIVLIGMAMLGLAVGLTLFAMRDSLVFFYTPSELLAKHVTPGQRFRLGGLVEKGSVKKKGATVSFVVTDLTAELPVTYTGILPDLFREGQGVVAEGSLQTDGSMQATSVLAKHDEKYMPKAVADKLKASGHWEEGSTK